MREILLIAGGGVFVFVCIVAGSTFNQANQERLELAARLEARTQILAESFEESIGTSYQTQATSTAERVITRFSDNERLAGLGIFDSSGVPFVISEGFPGNSETSKHIASVMDSDEPDGAFVETAAGRVYAFVMPLHEERRVVGALVVIQNANYIDESVWNIWQANLFRFLSLMVLFIGVLVFLVWWVFFRPLARLTESIRSLRTGLPNDAQPLAERHFLNPLVGEIRKTARSLAQARVAASEEARLRLEKLDTPWTAGRLREFIKARLGGKAIFVVSNREPYIHTKARGKIEWSQPAGGVVTALEPVMTASGGVWVAHGSGNADHETADAEGKLAVPIDEPSYTLKRVWLTDTEVAGHYAGFSNEALLPVCLLAHVRPLFRLEDWKEYQAVNEKFGDALLAEMKEVREPIVLVQDYHLALLPEYIKSRRPDAKVVLFWHIPWPSAEAFAICPWRAEIIEGMLGADLIGFHTQQHSNSFLDTVASEMESLIDYEQFSVMRGGHHTYIKPFPASVAVPTERSETPSRATLDRLGIHTDRLMLGVDRLDYTKGLLERFKALEFFLERYPDTRGTFTFLQIAPLTRQSIQKYREYTDEVMQEVERINEKFATRAWKPIVLETRNYSHEELVPLYRLADVCLITSLHDGMNLVAKEYAAARDDEDGVLILSSFTGAARDLKSALIVNPYSAEKTSQAIHTAFSMPEEERKRRMRAMRNTVQDYNTYRWSAEIIKAIDSIE